MKPQKPTRRSVSPFGLEVAPPEDDLLPLKEAFQKSRDLSESMAHLLSLFEKVWDAPANDTPDLNPLCESLLHLRMALEEKGLWSLCVAYMEKLLNRKTELFMLDHYDKDHLEKMGWAGEYRDVVLFSRERDIILGRFFGPAWDQQPGEFSRLVNNWVETDNPDRALHFLDFAAGSKNPTLDHYLLFSHPALMRVLRDKGRLKDLFQKGAAVSAKLVSPTWEKDARAALGV